MVEEIRNKLEELTQFFYENWDQENSLMEYASMYKEFLSIETLLKARAFYVPDFCDEKLLPEKFHDNKLGILGTGERIIISGGVCYPVCNGNKDIVSFIKHDPESSAKYLDIKPYGFIPKRYMLYGMEEMLDYYTTNEEVYITEGLTDTLALRQVGKKALAILSSSVTKYQDRIIKRLKNPVIVPDNDIAGTKMFKYAKYNKLRVRYPDSNYNDMYDMLADLHELK